MLFSAKDESDSDDGVTRGVGKKRGKGASLTFCQYFKSS